MEGGSYLGGCRGPGPIVRGLSESSAIAGSIILASFTDWSGNCVNSFSAIVCPHVLACAFDTVPLAIGSRITRWVDKHLLEEMQRSVRARPEKVKRRKCIVEHAFGTIKHSMNQGYFLTRRLPNVRSEMSVTVLAYNIKRVLKMLGVKNLLAALA